MGRILFGLAWRNLFSHKGKNLIVGLIMIFGSMLVVLGTSLLDSMERSMTKSITSSLAGHLQVYSKDAQDDLALFGDAFMGADDIGTIPDFRKVKEVLSAVDNVKAVIPMGMDTAEFYTTNELDLAIAALRKAMAVQDLDAMAAMQEKIRAMAALMKKEAENRLKILRDTATVHKQIEQIEEVLKDSFWHRLSSHPDEIIEYLDTKLAPLVEVDENLFMRYLGCDLHQFARNFDRFEIVEGKMVPQGQRGLLINQRFYKRRVRNRVARMFDQIHQDVIDQGKMIKKDTLLRDYIERMVRQYRRITFQLDPAETKILEKKLLQLMPNTKGNIDELVQQFLRVNDENFAERYAFFNKEIAPLIQLYRFGVGDIITIRAYTKSGYVKSVNLKVYGIFHFKGLEESDLAGSHNLVDMLTFRDMYGLMTTEKRKELQKIKNQIGLEDITRDGAEEALFGKTESVEAKIDANQGFDEFAGVNLKIKTENGKAIHDTHFTQADIDQGMALHAAIILHDPNQLAQTQAAIEQASKKYDLNLQVVDWQHASGIVGQVVVLVRVILYVAIFIIFMVALVIINNTMVMATMERMMEIGTIRAIGGQASFVLILFMLETLLLGAAAGLLGTLLGAAFVDHLHQVGIPAVENVLVLLFSGPRLYPTFSMTNLIAAWMVILLVSLVSTFYPAFIATRIQPVVAMQPRE